jgi:Family of unknown function (DUF6335)
MAKRKTARPSRTRAPGAARAKSGRSRTSTKRAKAGTARKTVRGRTSAARPATPRSAAKKTTSARSGPARATTRATAKAPAKTANRGARTLARTRSPRRPQSSATPGGLASAVPRRDKRRRGLPARLLQIERDRRLLEEEVPTPPSSLNLDRRPSAARSGRAEMEEALHEHTATGPALTAGDLDADWESAYSTGDQAPGGDMPTPDQAVVEEIGTAMGVEYADNEELKGVDKIEERDRHRWELDPASAEDYQDRARVKGAKG